MLAALLEKIMFARIKTAIVRKAVGLTGTSTAGVAGLIVIGGGWIVTHPDVVSSISPRWAGVIVAGAGLVVALARARSL
jgi:hypothetical protein